MLRIGVTYWTLGCVAIHVHIKNDDWTTLKSLIVDQSMNRFLGNNTCKHRKYAKDQHKLQFTNSVFYEDFKLQCKGLKCTINIPHKDKDLVAITVQNHPQSFNMVVCLLSFFFQFSNSNKPRQSSVELSSLNFDHLKTKKIDSNIIILKSKKAKDRSHC